MKLFRKVTAIALTLVVIATLGICLPSFAVIWLISLFFDAFLSLAYVQYAFFGIRVGVIYLILTAGLRMLKKMKKDALRLSLFTVTLLGTLLLSLLAVKLSTVLWILLGGCTGLAVYFAGKARKEAEKR